MKIGDYVKVKGYATTRGSQHSCVNNLIGIIICYQGLDRNDNISYIKTGDIPENNRYCVGVSFINYGFGHDLEGVIEGESSGRWISSTDLIPVEFKNKCDTCKNECKQKEPLLKCEAYTYKRKRK